MLNETKQDAITNTYIIEVTLDDYLNINVIEVVEIVSEMLKKKDN